MTTRKIRRLDEVANRIEEIEDSETFWTPETLTTAGAVVTLDYRGEAEIHYGDVKPEDRTKKARPTKTVTILVDPVPNEEFTWRRESEGSRASRGPLDRFGTDTERAQSHPE